MYHNIGNGKNGRFCWSLTTHLVRSFLICYKLTREKKILYILTIKYKVT